MYVTLEAINSPVGLSGSLQTLLPSECPPKKQLGKSPLRIDSHPEG